MAELTNSLRKMIHGLGSSKNRRAEGLFVAEGTRCVLETLGLFNCRYFIATQKWVDEHCDKLHNAGEIIIATQSDISRISQQKTPQPVIAVYEIPTRSLDLGKLTSSLVLALDTVQDPGNLGTIIRIADWFGISDIICSADTVDLYNPKVVQATMGAIARVAVHYVPLCPTLAKLANDGQTETPIYGTFLDGDNIYETNLSPTGVIIMGNEGNGISPEVAKMVNHRLLIPSFPPNRPTVESLNVGMATAITVAEFRRRSTL